MRKRAGEARQNRHPVRVAARQDHVREGDLDDLLDGKGRSFSSHSGLRSGSQ